MAVLIDIAVSADDFVCGRLFEDYSNVEMEFERVVPTGERLMPLLWIERAPTEAVEAALRADPMTEDASVRVVADDRSLFEIEWRPERNGVLAAIAADGVSVLTATGGEGEWGLRLRFDTHDDLSRFRERCAEEGVEIRLRRLYDPTGSDDEDALTEAQYELIEAALERGYWDIPRGNTLGEVAERIGISTNAASQRLRRGVKTLIEDAVRER